MGKNIDLREKQKNDTGFLSGHWLFLNSPVYKVNRGVDRSKRIFIHMAVVLGILLALSSCVGYVASEPSYVEIDRPVRPGAAYIWIDGGWRWNGATHVYVHRPGYWARPHEGRSFESGHWESTPRGKRWVNGHWRRENRENDHHER